MARPHVPVAGPDGAVPGALPVPGARPGRAAAADPPLSAADACSTGRSGSIRSCALQSVQDPTGCSKPGLPPAYGFALVMLRSQRRCSTWLGRAAVCACGTPAASRSCSASSREDIEDKDERAGRDARAGSASTPRRGRSRTVGANPILWREIFTRAYGRRPLLVKTAYFVVLALSAGPPCHR